MVGILLDLDPSRLASEASGANAIVSRRSRLTTECHAGVLLEEMMLGESAGASPKFEPSGGDLAALFDGPPVPSAA